MAWRSIDGDAHNAIDIKAVAVQFNWRVCYD